MVRVVGVASAPAVLLVAVVIVVAMVVTTKERWKGRKGGEGAGIGNK